MTPPDKVKRPWDDFELSDGPAREMTLRDYVWLCDGDLSRAMHYCYFKSDIAEPGDPPPAPDPTCAEATEVEGFHYLVEYLVVKHGISTPAFTEALQKEVLHFTTCPCWPVGRMKLLSQMTDDGMRFVLVNEPH